MSNLNSLPAIDELWLRDGAYKPLPGTIVPCLMCAKPFLMRMYSGYPDQVCPECFETYKDCCSILCWRCKVCVAKVKPGVTDSGFYVRPRSVLHLNKCNVCDPNILESTIIEMDLWYQQIGKTKKLIVPFHREGG